METDSPSEQDITKDDSNICSVCGGVDNTSHICDSNRYQDPQHAQIDIECQLKRKQRDLDQILKKLREARRESYMYVSQVSEAERILKERIKGQELVEIRHQQLAMRALSESLEINELMKAVSTDKSVNSGYSFNIPDLENK